MNFKSVRVPCATFKAKRTASIFSAQVCPKADLGLEIQKTNVGKKSLSSRYHMCQFSGKTDNFRFNGLNFPKNGFRAGNSEN